MKNSIRTFKIMDNDSLLEGNVFVKPSTLESIGNISIQEIHAGANFCTHLIYGFAAIDSNDYHVKPIDKKLDLDKGNGLWMAVTSLKKTQPGLSVLLSVGGYEDDENEEKYFQVLEKPERRTKFIDSVVALLRDFRFDGIDLAWQFPPQQEKYEKTSIASIWHNIKKTFGAGVDSRASEHRDQFVALCRELKAQLRPYGRILSVGVLPHINSTTYMDVRNLMPYVDMVNLWTVDFRTPDRSPLKADFVHPLVYLYTRLPHENVEAVVNTWMDNGAEPQKLNLGIGTWGRSWKLTEDSGVSGTPPVIANGYGEKGPYTKTDGLLSYYEVCIKLVSPTNPTAPAGMLRKVDDTERKMGSYAFRLPNQKAGEVEGLWVGFEEPNTAVAKANFAKSRGLGGVAILDLGLDDSRGICDGNMFPITRAAKLSLDDISAQPAAISSQPGYGNVQLPEPGYGNVQVLPSNFGNFQSAYDGVLPQQPTYDDVQNQQEFVSIQTSQQGFGGVQTPQLGFGTVQTSQLGFSGFQPAQSDFNYTPNLTQIIYSLRHNGQK